MDNRYSDTSHNISVISVKSYQTFVTTTHGFEQTWFDTGGKTPSGPTVRLPAIIFNKALKTPLLRALPGLLMQILGRGVFAPSVLRCRGVLA